MPVLHLIQEVEGFISPQAQKQAAEILGIPPVHVHEVVSFYHLFDRKKKGECHFAVCQTTSCALLGAEKMIEHLENRLGIKPGQTTPDGKFSLSTVECLGACEIAPMMQVNKEYQGFLNTEKIDQLIDEQR